MAGLDAVSAGETVAEARPDAILCQITTILPAHAGKLDSLAGDGGVAATAPEEPLS
jgi:hypothetical protein